MFLLEEAVAHVSSSLSPYWCTSGYDNLDRLHLPTTPGSREDVDFGVVESGDGGGARGGIGGADGERGGAGAGAGGDSLDGHSVDENYHVYGSGSESGLPSPMSERKQNDDAGSLSQFPPPDTPKVFDGSGFKDAGVSAPWEGAREKGGVGGVIYPSASDLDGAVGGGVGSRGARSPTWGEASWGSWTTVGAGGVHITSLRGDGPQGEGAKRLGSKVGLGL